MFFAVTFNGWRDSLSYAGFENTCSNCFFFPLKGKRSTGNWGECPRVERGCPKKTATRRDQIWGQGGGVLEGWCLLYPTLALDNTGYPRSTFTDLSSLISSLAVEDNGLKQTQTECGPNSFLLPKTQIQEKIRSGSTRNWLPLRLVVFWMMFNVQNCCTMVFKRKHILKGIEQK